MIFYHSRIEATFQHLFWSYLKILKPVILTCAFGKVESNFDSDIRKISKSLIIPGRFL